MEFDKPSLKFIEQNVKDQKYIRQSWKNKLEKLCYHIKTFKSATIKIVLY